MNNQGKVISLQVCPGHRKPMTYVTSLEAIEGKGLKGDMHALPESSRQVLLIEQETLERLDLTPGLVKENITTSGIALMKLKSGQRVQIGQTILQITKPCEPCNRMEEIRKGLKVELEDRRGILARVVRSGVMNIGDPITLL